MEYPTNLQVNGCLQKHGTGLGLGLRIRAVSKQVIDGDTGANTMAFREFKYMAYVPIPKS